jgi:hypothetical protein
MGINSSMSPDKQTGPLCATGSQNDPKAGQERESGKADAPLFPKSRLPVFSLLFAFGEII